MERQLERAEKALKWLSKALEEYEAAQDALSDLEAYYGSDEWKQDFRDDEAGLMPNDLKRGVLSEDGIWNVLEMASHIKNELQSMCDTLKR